MKIMNLRSKKLSLQSIKEIPWSKNSLNRRFNLFFDKIFAMHNVLSAQVPNLWKYKTAGALAGAAASRGGMHVFNIIPSSQSGLLLRAGFALAGGWVCSKLAQEMHSRAIVDLRTKSHKVITYQLFALSVLSSLTAAVAMTTLYSELIAPAYRLFSPRMVFIFFLFEFSMFLWVQLDEQKRWVKERANHVLSHSTAEQFRQLIPLVMKEQILGWKDRFSWRFLDVYINRNDVSSSEAMHDFRAKIANEPNPALFGKDLSETTLKKLLAHLPVDKAMLTALLTMTSGDADKQKLILEKFPLGPDYVCQGARPVLHQEIIQALMANEKASVWDVAFCTRQQKSLAPRLALFDLEQLFLLAENYVAALEPWHCCLIKEALESLPGEKVETCLKMLQQQGSTWLPAAIGHVENGKTQLTVSKFKNFQREIIETLFTMENLLDTIHPGELPQLLNMTAYDPVKQIQILEKHPLDQSYILHVEDDPSCRFYYPRLADATMNYLMDQEDRSVWDIAFCARQRPSLRAAFVTVSDDELIKLGTSCLPDGSCCLDNSICWESSLIKVAVQSLSPERADAFVKKLSKGEKSAWFKFALRHVLRGNTQLDDATLIKWVNWGWEDAYVIVAARPQLHDSCGFYIKRMIDVHMDAELYMAVLESGAKEPYYSDIDPKTRIKALNNAINRKNFKVANQLTIQGAYYSDHNTMLGTFLHADVTYLNYLITHSALFRDFCSVKHYSYARARGVDAASRGILIGEFSKKGLIKKGVIEVNLTDFSAFYKIWHSTHTQCFPLEFFFSLQLPAKEDFSRNVQTYIDASEPVLFWLAKVISGEAFTEAPTFVQEQANLLPKAFGRIVGLWEHGKKGAEERLPALLKALNLNNEPRIFFEANYHCSLVDTYKDFILEHYDHFYEKLRLGDITIIDLASHLALQGRHYDASQAPENIPAEAGAFSSLQNEAVIQIARICH